MGGGFTAAQAAAIRATTARTVAASSMMPVYRLELSIAPEQAP